MGNVVANGTGNIYYSKVSGTTDYLFTNADPEFDEQVVTGVTSSEFVAPRLEKGPVLGQRIARLTVVLGAEKVTNGTFTGAATGWTVAVDWAYASNAMTHSAGVAGTLSQDVSAVATETYRVEYTITGLTAGTVRVSIGGATGQIRSYNGTFVEYLTATSTAVLAFTASAAAVLTLDTVSVKKVVIGIIGSKVVTSADLTTRDSMTLWLRSSVNVNSNELQLLLDNTANCASPVETLNLPALVANEWVRTVVKLNNPESDGAIISIGIKVVANNVNSNLGAYTLDIYQPRLMDEFEGRKSFNITENVDSLDCTDYQSLTSRQYQHSYSSWTATIEGHKEGPPPLIKGQRYLFAFVESDVVGQAFIGEGEYTGFTPSGNFAELVTYPYVLQGSDLLYKPTA